MIFKDIPVSGIVHQFISTVNNSFLRLWPDRAKDFHVRLYVQLPPFLSSERYGIRMELQRKNGVGINKLLQSRWRGMYPASYKEVMDRVDLLNGVDKLREANYAVDYLRADTATKKMEFAVFDRCGFHLSGTMDFAAPYDVGPLAPDTKTRTTIAYHDITAPFITFAGLAAAVAAAAADTKREIQLEDA